MQLFQDPETKPPFFGTWSQVHHSGYISFCVCCSFRTKEYTTDTKDMADLCLSVDLHVHRWCVVEDRICKIYIKTGPIHRTHIYVVLLRCVSGKPKARQQMIKEAVRELKVQ
jgi:hypothetical protein